MPRAELLRHTVVVLSVLGRRVTVVVLCVIQLTLGTKGYGSRFVVHSLTLGTKGYGSRFVVRSFILFTALQGSQAGPPLRICVRVRRT